MRKDGVLIRGKPSLGRAWSAMVLYHRCGGSVPPRSSMRAMAKEGSREQESAKVEDPKKTSPAVENPLAQGRGGVHARMSNAAAQDRLRELTGAATEKGGEEETGSRGRRAMPAASPLRDPHLPHPRRRSPPTASPTWMPQRRSKPRRRWRPTRSPPTARRVGLRSTENRVVPPPTGSRALPRQAPREGPPRALLRVGVAPRARKAEPRRSRLAVRPAADRSRRAPRWAPAT